MAAKKKSTKRPTVERTRSAESVGAERKPASGRGASAKQASARKAARPAKTSRTRAARPPALTDDERLRLLKPPADYDDALASMVRALAEHPSVRVDGVSRARLSALGKRAARAWDREEAFRQKMAPKLAALEDARLVAEDEVWRAALDVWDMAKSVGRRRPEVREAFSFMSDYVGGGPRRPTGDDPSDDPRDPAPTPEPDDS